MKNNQSFLIFWGIDFAEYTLFLSIQSISGLISINQINILMYMKIGIKVLNFSRRETYCKWTPPNI